MKCFSPVSFKNAAYTMATVLLAWLSVAVVANAEQLEFQRLEKPDRLELHYQMSSRHGAVPGLSITLNRQAVSKAAGQFQAVDNKALRKRAKAKWRRHLLESLAELEREFPGVAFTLEENDRVRWTIGPASDLKATLKSSSAAWMNDALIQIRQRYPEAQIQRTADGHLKYSAPDSTQLGLIKRDLQMAMQDNQRRQRELLDQTQAQIDADAVVVRQRVKAAIEALTSQMYAFEHAYFERHWYQVLDDLSLLPDYARIAEASLVDLQATVRALRPWLRGLGRREAINRLLLWVQSIPYDPLQDRATDAGFLFPLSVVAQNRGDCDSKSVLFAALLHKLYPGTPVALVLLERHALLALGVQAQAGDFTLRHAHRDWVLAEPVGPRELQLGQVGDEYRQSGQKIEQVLKLF